MNPSCRRAAALGVAAFAALAVACAPSDEGVEVHTLYESGTNDPTARVHVATFDAPVGAGYNGENCRLVAELLDRARPSATRHWCEKGTYRH